MPTEEIKTQILDLNPKPVRRNGQPVTRAVTPGRADVEMGLHKVDWAYGQALAPHHFQQQARYHARHVEMAVRAAFPYPWGVVELKLDEQALASGHVVAERFAAIMPDGTPVVVGPKGNARLPARSFEAELRAKAEVDVYVGLLHERADAANVSGDDSVRARFTPMRTTMRDFGTGRDPVELDWLSDNLRLMSDADSHEDYATLRIARLRRSDKGRVENGPNFAPPSLRLSASPILEQAVVSVVGALEAASSALWTQRGGNLPDMARTLVLTRLGELLSDVTPLLADRSTSAWHAFRALSRVVATLAAYSPQGVVEVLPYQHDAPGPVFAALATEAQRVLYWVGAPPYRPIPLAPTHEDGVWTARLSEPGLLGRPLFLVVSGADPQVIHADVAHLIKAAPVDEIQRLVTASTGGVPLVAEKKRLQGLPVSARSACFRFDTRSPTWQHVIAKGTLAIAMPLTNPPLELSLFVENEKP